MTGVVRSLMMEKGFGFIRGSDGRDYFFHRSDMAHEDFERLHQGSDVRFVPQDNPKGPRAAHIEVI